MALLGKQCWGSAEETQPYDNDGTLLYAAASPLQPNVGERVEQAEVVCDAVTKEQHEQSITTEQPSDDVHMASPPSDPKDVPMEVVEPPKSDTLASPPVLKGCLAKNFKCPVVILEHDVRVIMGTGFTKEVAEEALVKARGDLPSALGALIRERYDLKPHAKAAMTKPAAAAAAAAEPRSPLPTEIVDKVEPVSRQEQQKLRDELRGTQDEEPEEDEEANCEDEKPKRKPRAKAKAKAKAQGKAKPGRKPKAKAQPKAKGRGRPKKSPSAGTQEQEPGKDAKSPTTSKHSGKQSEPKRKRKGDAAPAAPVPKSSKRGRTKKGAEQSVKEKSTFAKRFLPKTEPQRSVWVAASKAYEGIKHKLKAPSQLEDWCYYRKPCSTLMESYQDYNRF